jgi:hypothetical protein
MLSYEGRESEEKNVERWGNSDKAVDVVYLLGPGPSDSAVALA